MFSRCLPRLLPKSASPRWRGAWNSGVLVTLLLSTPVALASEGPIGECYAILRPVKDTFVLDFTERRRNSTDPHELETRRWRIVYAKDGTVKIPRHRPEVPVQKKLWGSDHLGTITEGYSINQDNASKSNRAFWLADWTKAKSSSAPLPLDGNEFDHVHWATVTAQGIGMVGLKRESRGTGSLSEYWLVHVERQGFRPAKEVKLGFTPRTFIGGPSASAPLWAQGRWWVAWVRGTTPSPADLDEEKPPLPKDLQMVLTAYDPATETVVHKEIPTGLSGATDVELAINGGWAALAWQIEKAKGLDETNHLRTAFVELSGGE